MAITRFKSESLWKMTKYEEWYSNEKIEVVGKFCANRDTEKNFFLGELLDPDMNMITLVRGKESWELELEDGNYYRIEGRLKKYPDKYSVKTRLYLQIKVEKAELLKVEEYPEDLTRLLKKKENLFKVVNNREKITKEKIEQRIKRGTNYKFLYIVSDKGNNGKTDILNDLYEKEWEKKNLLKYYDLDIENGKNIKRVKFGSGEIITLLEELKETEDYDALVFIKGGGNNMIVFDDIDFCAKVVETGKPFITAVGHSDDRERLLNQLADIDYGTPTRCGVDFLRIVAKVYWDGKNTKISGENLALNDSTIEENFWQEDSLEQDIKIKDETIKVLKEKIQMGEKRISSLEKELNGKKFKGIMALFIIILLLGYGIFATFFMNKAVTIEAPVKAESIKQEKKKVNISSTFPLIKDKKKTEEIKKPTAKKLVYSEDEVYTVLLWKGYKGERAIIEFQRDNGMKQTGKIDENLLKKLGIKIKYN